MIRRMRRPAPNPNGPGYTPRITSAGVAGQTPPELQGLPVPLPPAGPGPQVPDYPPPGVPVPVEIGGH
jgi:phospholipid/cholesterol/gamma-HCH transport system substrate-binding protein